MISPLQNGQKSFKRSCTPLFFKVFFKLASFSHLYLNPPCCELPFKNPNLTSSYERMASPISTESSLSLTQGNQSSSTALQTATALFAPTQFLAALMGGKSAEPSCLIIYKHFGFLKSINLRTVGLKLEDIPYKFGWDLV